MSRPPKTNLDESDETIYTANPTYDPIAAMKKAASQTGRRPASPAAPDESTEGREASERGTSPQNPRRSGGGRPPATGTGASAGYAQPPVGGGGAAGHGLEWYADVSTDHIHKRNTVVLNRDVSRINDNGAGEEEEGSDSYYGSGKGRGQQSAERHPLLDHHHTAELGINQISVSAEELAERRHKDAFLEQTFFQAMASCGSSPFSFISDWAQEMRDTIAFSYSRARSLTVKEVAFFFAFLFILTSTQLCSVFGFNFWLHSFSKGTATYVSIVVPSVIYAIVNALLIPVFKYRQKPGESLLFWAGSRESIIMLVAIGLADSVTGMTATYAVPHIPVIVQTSVSSCGAIFVYVLHRFLYKKTALPFSFLLMTCFVFLIGSVVISVAPLYLEGRTDTHIEGRWIGVYMFVIVAPAIYNVVQGRFLGKYAGREDVPPTTSKFVVLTGDYWVQALVSFAYFPLDFTPGFGPSANADAAWGNAKDALACIVDCEHNWIYLVLYVFGFWSGRVLRTIMNLYSPTMGQFVMQLMGPIKAFAIVLFPALNIKGKQQNPAYNAGTFGALIVATLFYLLANEQQRMKVARRKEREAAEEEERGRNERGAGFLGGGAGGEGAADYAKSYDDPYAKILVK